MVFTSGGENSGASKFTRNTIIPHSKLLHNLRKDYSSFFMLLTLNEPLKTTLCLDLNKNSFIATNFYKQISESEHIHGIPEFQRVEIIDRMNFA